MKRDPSIHITRSQFEDIINTLQIDNFPTEAFFTIARKTAINSRAVLTSKQKEIKSISKTLLASMGDAQMAADIYYMCRIKMHHIGVRKINPNNTKDWSNCKSLAEVCNNFCDSFQLPTREGFIKYMEIGFSRIGKNSRGGTGLLQRLISMSENISAHYEAEIVIKDCKDGSTVNEMCNYYTNLIASSTGMYEDFSKEPLKYVHFVHLYNFLESKRLVNSYKEWIRAQFEALSFCNGIPRLEDLYNDKAIERYNKFKFQSIKKEEDELETPEVSGSLWDKIK